MRAKVLEKQAYWLSLEYEDSNGLIQRKMLPTCMIPILLYVADGIVDIDDDLMKFGVDNGNVDLTTVLGNELKGSTIDDVLGMLRLAGLWRDGPISASALPTIPVISVQDKFRRAELWTWSDYLRNQEKIVTVLEDVIVQT